MNGSRYYTGKSIDLNDCETYRSIDSIRTEISQTSTTDTTRLLAQRTDAWFELRKNAKVTGSTLLRAVRCDGLGKQK
jgi:hypothetical protein